MKSERKILSLLIIVIMSFYLFSCTGKSTDRAVQENENIETKTVAENDFSESDQDLFTVDYREIYSELSDKGEWVQIEAKEIGIDPNTSYKERDLQRQLSNLILGVNDAYADVDVGMLFVWKPSPDLAIGLTAGDAGVTAAVAPVYRPYYNGQWMYTDNGWYFTAPTPEEEIVHHYGRWYNDPVSGWLWVPGRVWSPAWVTYREDDVNIAWAPIPPRVYFTNQTLVVPTIPVQQYVFVEKRYFVEPQVFRFERYNQPGPLLTFEQMVTLPAPTIVGSSVFNTGPDVQVISQVIGRPVTTVAITKVKSVKDVTFTSSEVKTFVPKFKKKTTNNRLTFSSPPQFKKHAEVKEKIKGNDNQRNDAAGKNQQKNLKGPDVNQKKIEKQDNKMKGTEKPGNQNMNKQRNDNSSRNKDVIKQKGNQKNKGTVKQQNQKQGSSNKSTTKKGSNNKGSTNKGSKNKGKNK